MWDNFSFVGPVYIVSHFKTMVMERILKVTCF